MRVEFGKPLKKLSLTYEVSHCKDFLPTPDLYLYDNGTYWIRSAGVDFYGVFVVTEGSLADPRFEIKFIAFPSPYSGGQTVYHHLHFDATTGRFTQDAANARDPEIPPQGGVFRINDNTAIIR
ncbi:hypothetical protein [Mycobacterium montefiorense]|uniref:Uncharacterized protein n=1 Tax=Mycobacterium montefiorense TaxID=154654 RepID=A0AA37PNB8_9MYCO|nr:hypothetical protein [Mycobacterium montefiorense]GBG37873.1 hypothetical protein MmonteBS_22450 [Mycobacterium montefiorense]GKU35011.1 hypothetical protein NJB14191_23570 [Mycobacterium montefiorense]GKU41022.1 hypothetical protein NJB14192_30080 [Mycobacterium montefiorense]GKU47133.1 hypothetical protein NJB14194_37510 [Mycobacterium montefiorense]GKU49253.1 hypothetical protein NJB14195_05000 [Mycobacterium montefiorense]